MQSQQTKLMEVQAEVAESRFQLQEQKRELQLLKDFMRAMRNANPSMRILADQMEADEVRRWAESLPKARVLRWGGMISTPDTVLQVRSHSNISLDPNSASLDRWRAIR